MIQRRPVLAIVCFIFLLACSGVKKAIISAKAYSLMSQTGTVQVDEKGNELAALAQTVITVYIQSKYDEVTFDSAWINDIRYPVLQQKIVNPIEVGVEENSGQKVTIRPSEENYTYQLQVVPKVKKGEELPASISVRLLLKGKAAVKAITPITRIQAYDAQ